MGLSAVKTYSKELKSKTYDVIKEHGDGEVQDIVLSVTLYTLSHNLDIKSYLFDEQYNYLGSPSEKVKRVINSSFDFLSQLLHHRDFSGVMVSELEESLKSAVYEFLAGKLEQGELTKENFQSFVEYLQQSYDPNILLDVLRLRIVDDEEKRSEFKALLEYMIFSGRNYFEEDEFERIQRAIDFRLNCLKNYSSEYFTRNFFLLQNQIRLFPEEYHSIKYFFPYKIFKDVKNLILSIERGESHSLSLQSDARDIIQRQLRLIKQNEKKLNELKGD
ncbi:MAG: hypothetical protein ACQESG_07290 [Nanobdellota archaeon]